MFKANAKKKSSHSKTQHMQNFSTIQYNFGKVHKKTLSIIERKENL